MNRRYYKGKDVSRALSVEELRRMAECRLPSFVFEFLESGGEDEVSLQWNREVFKSLRFVPSTLVNTVNRNIKASYLGREWPSPLIIAPTGHNGMLWPEADVCLARAAAKFGIPFTLSTMSNIRLEKLPGLSGGSLWMQLYVFNDPKLTRDILERAKDAGYEALVFTTDVNVFGWREWDRRRYRAPGKLSWRSMLDLFFHPSWAYRTLLPHGPPRFANVADHFPPEARDTRSTVTRLPGLFSANIDWKTVSELRRLWPRKLLIKGILAVDDAKRAVKAGCDGIVVSNHGARHLDSCISPVEVLPEIAGAVGDKLAIVVDSGFRRGSDVIKALALGAHAVMVGRAPLYGLAAGGEAGVLHALQLLNDEIARVLGQIGKNSLGELGPRLIKGSSVSDFSLQKPA